MEETPEAPRPRRRWLAPEVIQTSAMDCGPAALKCLLDGYGVGVSYGRLREACQTSVDGTSIDTLETLAQSLGLDAEQVMMPVDHLLTPEADALPAIVVVRLPSGLTHFVVVWRAHGDFVQVMDPARGRRWVRRAAFLRDVYVHRLAIPAADFTDWVRSDGFTGPLRRRMRGLGIAATDANAAVARASSAEGWSTTASLDTAVRTVTALRDAGAVAAGSESARLVEALAAGVAAAPEVHTTATAAPAGDDGAERVHVRGAVLVRVTGARALDAEQRAALPLELRTAIEEPRVRAWTELGRLLGGGGLRWRALALGVVLVALGTVVEGVLFRGLMNVVEPGGGFVLVLAVLAALALLEWPLAFGLRRAGGRIEDRFRTLFLRKIPRLPDRYFGSRPVSDMAERAHLVHRLRGLPVLAGDVARTGLEIGAIAVGLAWLDPAGAVPALVTAAAMWIVPFAAEPAVAERDLRMRNHAGALGRFYLDGLLGLVAVRTHGGEPALAREHRDRLAEWVRAARAALRAALAAEAISALLGFGLAAWLLAGHFSRGAAGGGHDPGGSLLITYWALSLPVLGYELALLVQQLPAQRNLTLRLVEPLGAPEEAVASGTPAAARAAGAIDIRLRDVRVVAAGHPILAVDDLHIAPGETVGIVGASGAGKSSLLGLLLGWHRPAEGSVAVDGAPLDAVGLESLRRRTVWVDPSVYLWNRPLASNLSFGLATPPDDLAGVLADASLAELVQRLPEGSATPLGEAGALVSGGEGQRVRFGRGLARPRPDLVLLDEPFRGLDREQRRTLLARARQKWAGATLLCVTHDIEETAAFPRVLVIDGGAVVEDGTPAELAARSGSRYAALLEAARRVQAGAWTGVRWRRLRLAGGRTVEDGA